MPLCPATGGNGVSLAFCYRWPGTAILLISASQVARIIGLSKYTKLTDQVLNSTFINHGVVGAQGATINEIFHNFIYKHFGKRKVHDLM
jgi:hypothetical protein